MSVDTAIHYHCVLSRGLLSRVHVRPQIEVTSLKSWSPYALPRGSGTEGCAMPDMSIGLTGQMF